MEKVKPTFSQSLFWDVDIEKMDVDRYAMQIIVRVLERGTIDDWRKVKSYYSIDTIRKAAVEARSLEPTAMTFAAAVTHTPIEEFRCYKATQSNRELSFYDDGA